jgi:FMN-dependent NADH-azoreductase
VNVLHIDSSATGAASASRHLTAATVQILRDSNPDLKVVYRDFADAAPAHLSPALLQAMRPQPGTDPKLDPEVADELHLTETLISEFLKADVVILGAPMYNFSIPSTLKAWIDRVAQAGRTFRYTEKGPVGLAGGKKVLVISSRGGLLSGTPAEAALDHQEAYLRAVMGFFGITDVQVIRAEGLALGADSRKQAIERALEELKLCSSEVFA